MLTDLFHARRTTIRSRYTIQDTNFALQNDASLGSEIKIFAEVESDEIDRTKLLLATG